LEKSLELLSFGPDGWGDELASGVWLTVRLALATLPFGLVLGFLVALARNSGNRWLTVPGNIFTTLFRGLPELLTLFIVFYGGQILLQKA
jgi:polar amino acid transport system permease protein